MNDGVQEEIVISTEGSNTVSLSSDKAHVEKESDVVVHERHDVEMGDTSSSSSHEQKGGINSTVVSENSPTIPISSTKNHLNDGKSQSISSTTKNVSITKTTDVNKAPEVIQKQSESIADDVGHTIPPLPQSVEMKNVNDGLQEGNITSKESSKTDTLLFSKKGVQQQSDTATLSSSSTNATSTTNTEQQVVQQQTDVATHGVIHAT